MIHIDRTLLDALDACEPGVDDFCRYFPRGYHGDNTEGTIAVVAE
jgi:hypothetical protein